MRMLSGWWCACGLAMWLTGAATAAAGQDDAAAPEPAKEQDPPTDDGADDGDATPTERGEGVSGNDRAAAESLRQLGASLMELGRLDEACPKLAQSLRASPDGRVALMLARCHEQEGKVASAWAEYRQAAAMLRGEGDGQAARRAHNRSIELEERVSKLTIMPSAQLPGMEAWRDGVRYSEGIFGVAVAVDPGKHVIEVRAPGYRSFRTEVELSARGDRKIVAVPPLARIGTDEAPFGADRRAGTAQAGAARPARKLSTLFDAAAITTTAGAAGLAVGTILGLSAARDVRTAQSNALLCGSAGRCTAEGYALIERADDKAIGSTVAFAVGGVAVAAGIGMFVIDAVWGDDDEPASRAVMPMIGPSGGGVRVRF